MDCRGPSDPVEAKKSVRTAVVLDPTILAELRKYQKADEPDFVTELIGVFTNDLMSRLTQIRTGLMSVNAQLVNQAAHALKGASGELGAEGMREICSRLEVKTIHGSLEGAYSMMLELEAEAKLVRSELVLHCGGTSIRSWMPGLKPY